ncbi:hypothetical protein AN964_02655 [Heyndrickxia shackletonii]|uniref:Uncharacterized protein n=1 Tax=Heyndrickxia shackletonii TaxID=157838 RepID=A0A0Q3WVC6_9BACI|nr:hypothetical protein AN964_02655 [Heyndrickxia shackletonii]
MVFLKLIGVILFTIIATLLQRPYLKTKTKREKWIYAIFIFFCLAIAALLIVKPDFPGPTQLVEKLYPPLLRTHK